MPQLFPAPLAPTTARSLQAGSVTAASTTFEAHEGNATRQISFDLGFTPVVPPHPRRVNPWSINEQLYRRRNEIERLFRRLKAFRRIFSRYDKLDVMFTAFIHLALIAEASGLT